MASILPAALNGGAESDRVLKSMDANRYATKKTIAQGMLDIALLTANASQLKYILQVGEKHEFYTLMLTLISISIILQLVVGILFVAIGSLNINRKHEQTAAIVLNDIILVLIFLISLINIAQGVACIVLANFDINKETNHKVANMVQNLSLGLNLSTVVVNIMINGLEVKQMSDQPGAGFSDLAIKDE